MKDLQEKFGGIISLLFSRKAFVAAVTGYLVNQLEVSQDLVAIMWSTIGGLLGVSIAYEDGKKKGGE